MGYIVFQNSSSLTAAKSHPHNVPLVVSTEKHPVRTGVQSEFLFLLMQNLILFSHFMAVLCCFALILLNMNLVFPGNFSVSHVLVDHTRRNCMTHSCYVLRFLMPEWIQQYTECFIQPDKLQQIVDSFMVDYDKRKEEVRILQLFLHPHPPKQCT